MTVYNRRIALKKLLLEKMNEIAATNSDLKEAEKKMKELWDTEKEKEKDLSYFMWADKQIKATILLPDLHVQLYEILALLFDEDSEWFLEERYSIK
ncbi:hypothetical protein GMB80_14320 [Turicibacter sanguinis]|nr:hypothetical protein [Turicibacter sanguinis]MTP74108.1 hypothetical protein [Turicibacter sanguinis]